MQKPLVTCVCLTTHPKRSAMLTDALRAYRQQTYEPRELLVVNDGLPMVSMVPDARVVNLSPKDGGWTIGEKRNIGVREAHGEYLATWDDDDVSLPSRLAEQVELAELWHSDYLLADRMFIADADLKLIGNCDRGRQLAVMPSALIRRSMIVAAGGYQPVNYLEDGEMLERIRNLVRGQVTTMVGAKFYVLRRHEANATLQAGEKVSTYVACAIRDPDIMEAQAAVDAIRRGPGGEDVIGSV